MIELERQEKEADGKALGDGDVRTTGLTGGPSQGEIDSLPFFDS